MASGGFDFDTEVRRRLVDMAAALEEISGTAGYKAILDVLSNLERVTLDVALEDEPEKLPTYRGQVKALRAIRESLVALRTDARTLAEEEHDEDTAERLGLDLGRGDIGID